MRALGLCMVLAIGCGPEGVGLEVRLQTDLVPGDDFEGVTVELREGAASTGPTAREAVEDLRTATGLADGVRVADFVDLAPGTYRISVRLGGDRPRRRDVLVELASDRVVTVAITRSCDDVVCPPGAEPTRTECAEGACVEPACVEPGSPRCSGQCIEDADCAEDAVACTVARCVRAACRAVPDDAACGAGERCHPSRGCEPGTCATSETACGDGVDDDCDGWTDCEDPECAGAACDDGDLCTHDDVCASGACAGAPIVCESDACATRSCDGSDACAIRPITAGTACEDEGNPCTRDECDGAGACAHPPAPAGAACPADDNECTSDACDGRGACAHPALPDGTPWSGGEFAACCGGRETQLNTRESCGGCGVACPGTRACNEVAFPDQPAHPACECTQADPACPGAQTCNGFLDFCFCTEDTHCPADQRCIRMPLPPSANTHNYCGY